MADRLLFSNEYFACFFIVLFSCKLSFISIIIINIIILILFHYILHHFHHICICVSVWMLFKSGRRISVVGVSSWVAFIRVRYGIFKHFFQSNKLSDRGNDHMFRYTRLIWLILAPIGFCTIISIQLGVFLLVLLLPKGKPFNFTESDFICLATLSISSLRARWRARHVKRIDRTTSSRLFPFLVESTGSCDNRRAG